MKFPCTALWLLPCAASRGCHEDCQVCAKLSERACPIHEWSCIPLVSDAATSLSQRQSRISCTVAKTTNEHEDESIGACLSCGWFSASSWPARCCHRQALSQRRCCCCFQWQPPTDLPHPGRSACPGCSVLPPGTNCRCILSPAKPAQHPSCPDTLQAT